VQDLSDAASHPAAIWSDDGYAIFMKVGETDRSRDEFARELAGLRVLTERSGALTPTVIGLVDVEGGVAMVLEAVEVVPRESLHWRQIGHALGQVHRAKSDRFGFETHCYWGALYQDNAPLPRWPEFYHQRRLAPRFRAAVDSGNLPMDLVPQIERLIARLPLVCGPEVTPSLLHGDCHQTNFITTRRGPVMIDPSVHYGHPEMDLAYIDFFTPVPGELFEGYRDAAPVDPGFAERRELWRIPAYLAMVELWGPKYLDRLIAAVRSYA
jgi:protein-ribulosamine 3-kinase